MSITTTDIRSMKGQKKITMVTAYDALMAKIVDSVGIPNFSGRQCWDDVYGSTHYRTSDYGAYVASYQGGHAGRE